ncbi:MAG TPA: NAD(P)H-binding protein [Puia sp.]|nr:NAD(P)H-binding protein [Puia sp.]
MEALGATAAIGTLQDAGFLRRVFEGADAVYLMIPPSYTGVTDVRAYYGEIGGKYVEAIRETGVERVVFLSSMGAELDKGTGVVLGVHDVEGLLDGISGVRITHLRPGYFYYNLYNYVGQIKGLGLITDNFGGEDKLVLVPPGDIAAAAAEELVVAGAVGRIRYIASDEGEASAIARALGDAIGKPGLKWEVCSYAQRLEALQKFGVPPAFAESLVEMNASVHAGTLYRQYISLALPPTGKVRLEDFLIEFAAAYKQGNVAQHGNAQDKNDH